MVSNHYSINIAGLKGLEVFALFFGSYFSESDAEKTPSSTL